MADGQQFESQVWLPEEEEWDDRDSALGSDANSISESLSSSVMAYEYENGRRYHAYEAGRYPVPNDEPEANRLDLQHRVWWLTLKDKLYHAPIEGDKIKTALDIGTGTGIWAIDFADQHPNCHIIGTDLSPIQPTWVPPNCEFMVDDADGDREWDFKDIDYIHSRLLVISFRHCETYIRRCYDALAPGGWLELQEAEFPSRCDDDTCPDNDKPGFMEFTTYVREAGRKSGNDWDCQNKFPRYLQETGFVNITREELKWPIGPWMDKDDERLGQIGAYMLANAHEFINGGGAFFTRLLGWSQEEFQVSQAKWWKRLYQEARSRHQYLPVTVHYAQKPFNSMPAQIPTSAPADMQTEPQAVASGTESLLNQPEPTKEAPVSESTEAPASLQTETSPSLQTEAPPSFQKQAPAPIHTEPPLPHSSAPSKDNTATHTIEAAALIPSPTHPPKTAEPLEPTPQTTEPLEAAPKPREPMETEQQTEPPHIPPQPHVEPASEAAPKPIEPMEIEQQTKPTQPPPQPHVEPASES